MVLDIAAMVEAVARKVCRKVDKCMRECVCVREREDAVAKSLIGAHVEGA